ncbi:hypothetical protein AB0M50_55835, partial [Nonomuraea fuscirosea]
MLPVDLPGTVRDALLAPLVDHHCHGVRRDDLSRAGFELLISAGGVPAPPGTTRSRSCMLYRSRPCGCTRCASANSPSARLAS